MNAATVAAICSAIAALSSAIVAILAMRIQRDNLLTSVRPEIVLDGWTRNSRTIGDLTLDVIAIDSIRNVGRGSALQAIVSVEDVMENNYPVVIGPIKRMSVLASNESAKLSSEITLDWKNCKPTKSGLKVLPIRIQILTWDTHNRRHETKYSLTAFESTSEIGGSSGFAPGLLYSSRITIVKPVWRLKLRGRLAGIPILRTMFRDKQQ
jgi:hypothetical protein